VRPADPLEHEETRPPAAQPFAVARADVNGGAARVAELRRHGRAGRVLVGHRFELTAPVARERPPQPSAAEATVAVPDDPVSVGVHADDISMPVPTKRRAPGKPPNAATETTRARHGAARCHFETWPQ
jgi:hypothetical protein